MAVNDPPNLPKDFIARRSERIICADCRNFIEAINWCNGKCPSNKVTLKRRATIHQYRWVYYSPWEDEGQQAL